MYRPFVLFLIAVCTGVRLEDGSDVIAEVEDVEGAEASTTHRYEPFTTKQSGEICAKAKIPDDPSKRDNNGRGPMHCCRSSSILKFCPQYNGKLAIYEEHKDTMQKTEMQRFMKGMRELAAGWNTLHKEKFSFKCTDEEFGGLLEERCRAEKFENDEKSAAIATAQDCIDALGKFVLSPGSKDKTKTVAQVIGADKICNAENLAGLFLGSGARKEVWDTNIDMDYAGCYGDSSDKEASLSHVQGLASKLVEAFSQDGTGKCGGASKPLPMPAECGERLKGKVETHYTRLVEKEKRERKVFGKKSLYLDNSLCEGDAEDVPRGLDKDLQRSLWPALDAWSFSSDGVNWAVCKDKLEDSIEVARKLLRDEKVCSPFASMAECAGRFEHLKQRHLEKEDVTALKELMCGDEVLLGKTAFNAAKSGMMFDELWPASAPAIINEAEAEMTYGNCVAYVRNSPDDIFRAIGDFYKKHSSC